MEKVYTVCTVYLPHVPVTKQEISNLISQLQPPFLMLGDMNARSPLWGDTGQTSPNTRGTIFEEIILDHPISLLNNNSFTHYHVQTNSYSIPDLSICSTDCILDFNYSVNEHLCGSDHYPIHIQKNNFDEALYENPDAYNIKKADWPTFKARTETHAQVTDYDSVDDIIGYITTIVTTAAQETIPKKPTKYRKPPIPWWSSELSALRRERNASERNLRRNPTIENRIAYNRNKARFRYHTKQQKVRTWQQYISSINQHTGLHKIWKKVQKISGKYKRSANPVLKDENGCIITDVQEIANTLATSFARVSGRQNSNGAFQQYRRSAEAQNLNFITKTKYNYNESITDREYNAALSSTSETSPGFDKITYSMIKNLHPSMTKLIVDAFNRIFNERQFPFEWTLSIIIAILKPEKDPMKSESFRPISLTICLCKLMEKIINRRLVWFLERNNHIIPQQSGFRANRSTTDNLIQIETNIRKTFCERQHMIAVFFDLKKAYDTAWRFGIMRELHRMGLRGNLPLFLQGFLSNRRLRVRVGKTLSTEKTMEEGIPQGSVLSCTCFMIAINSICQDISPTIGMTLYVDDFTIYATGATTGSIERRLQNAISKLQNWTDKTGFTFSTDKTYSLHVCHKRNCPKMAPNLTLYNKAIKNVREFKYLGVRFDSSLTWKPHITELKTKCNKILNLFKHLSFKRWGADRKSLLRLYVMLMKPILDYGSEVYSAAAKTYMDSVYAVQNAALRIATGAYRSSPIESLHSDCGLPPFKFFIERKMLNYAVRLMVGEGHPLHGLTVNGPGNIPAGSCMQRVEELLMEYDLNEIMAEPIADLPPWQDIPITVCTEMHQHNKTETPKHLLRQFFMQHVHGHSQDICLYTDGSKSQDGVGYSFISTEGRVSTKIPKAASIYTAELLAICDALHHSQTDHQQRNVTIITDSRSAIDGITKLYNSHPIVQKIINVIHTCNRTVTLCWVPSHVGVPLNEIADQEARKAADTDAVPISNINLPRSDIKLLIRKISMDRWSETWTTLPTTNKLRKFKPNSTPFNRSCFNDRQWERTLCRLRIGHTSLTHKHLMERSNVPYCGECLVPLSIEHIILECPSYTEERRRCFGTDPSMNYIMGELCEKDGPLYKFLIQLGIYNEI